MDKASVYAIIPARGGSKGLPRKNIYPLLDKPLIAYSIQAALKCNFITRCIVSTEDNEIKYISQEWGAEVIDRPEELAQDLTLSKDVIMHVLKTLANNDECPEIIALLQPTSPLRNEQHLNECIRSFIQSHALSSISVTEMAHHPYKSFYIRNNELTPVFEQSKLNLPRQILDKIYRQNGAIYLLKSKEFMKYGQIYMEPSLPYVMSEEDSVDIDNIMDIYIAETIIKNKIREVL